MKGYKGSTEGRCINQQYEVGETYTLDERTQGPLQMCLTGFHFCRKLHNVNKHYALHEVRLVLFEVETLGKVINNGKKSVTDKIRIIREVPREEWTGNER